MAIKALFGNPNNQTLQIKPIKPKKNKVASILKKATTVKKTSTVRKRSSNSAQSVFEAEELAQNKLANYKDKYELITTKQRLSDYLYASTDNLVSLDTETDGLNFYHNKVVGTCLHVLNEKGCYIPIYHKDVTNEIIFPDQMNPEEFVEVFNKFLQDKNKKFIYHNAKFDVKMMKHTFNIDLVNSIYWDTLNVACNIDEKESHALKDLHLKYCPDLSVNETESIEFGDLFKGLDFSYIHPEVAMLYAAGDPLKTRELYEWQKKYLEQPDLEKVKWVVENIEIPIIPVCIKMEEEGVLIDQDYLKLLKVKYEEKLKDIEKKVYTAIDQYAYVINDYIEKKLPDYDKLDNPIKLTSPKQLEILFYNIFKLKKVSVNKTDSDALILMRKHYPKYADIFDGLLKYRKINKLSTAFVTNFDKYIEEDGKVHCSINPTGAATGRFSCIAKDTLITTTKGLKKIQDIQIGDKVFCYDENDKLLSSKVLDKFNNGIRECIKITYINLKDSKLNHHTLICTPDHKIKTYSEWKEACQLEIFDVIYGINTVNNKTFYMVTDIEYINKSYEVYDLEINDNHNFMASNICVHNCSDPNLQQIPSHEKSIRKMFIADKGRFIIGSDYSKQEVFLAVEDCLDPKLLEVFHNHLDIYSKLGSDIFNVDYTDCLEHKVDKDGNELPDVNEAGKERRSLAKRIWLGITYGLGAANFAEGVNKEKELDEPQMTVEEAQKILNKIDKVYPTLTKWKQDIIQRTRELGYVETMWGKRRHLPDIKLPRYEIDFLYDDQGNKILPSCFEEDPFDWNLPENKTYTLNDIPKSIKDYISSKLNKKYVSRGEVFALQKELKDKYKLYLKDNGNKISTAERQAVNARIQGSAGNLTKLAMIMIDNDPLLKELDYRLCITVHDEVLGTAPCQNAEKAAKRVQELMVLAGKDKVTHLGIKTDIEIADRWYGRAANIKNLYEDIRNSGEIFELKDINENGNHYYITKDNNQLVLNIEDKQLFNYPYKELSDENIRDFLFNDKFKEYVQIIA